MSDEPKLSIPKLSKKRRRPAADSLAAALFHHQADQWQGINMAAFQAMLHDMRRYRADVTEQYARDVIEVALTTERPPLSESGQDIWESYQRHLRTVG